MIEERENEFFFLFCNKLFFVAICRCTTLGLVHVSTMNQEDSPRPLLSRDIVVCVCVLVLRLKLCVMVSHKRNEKTVQPHCVEKSLRGIQMLDLTLFFFSSYSSCSSLSLYPSLVTRDVSIFLLLLLSLCCECVCVFCSLHIIYFLMAVRAKDCHNFLMSSSWGAAFVVVIRSGWYARGFHIYFYKIIVNPPLKNLGWLRKNNNNKKNNICGLTRRRRNNIASEKI